jgi:hypothetical protein
VERRYHPGGIFRGRGRVPVALDSPPTRTGEMASKHLGIVAAALLALIRLNAYR